MTDFPEFLYKLTPRDEQVTPLDIVQVSGTASGNQVTLKGTVYTVPKGKILMLNTFCLEADAGAAQTITYMAGYATIGNNQLEFCIQDGTGIAAGGSMYRTFYPKQMFGEDTVISCYGVYSGLANSNDIFATLHGILIPRGNFAI